MQATAAVRVQLCAAAGSSWIQAPWPERAPLIASPLQLTACISPLVGFAFAASARANTSQVRLGGADLGTDAQASRAFLN